jgi:FkbH-like protein
VLNADDLGRAQSYEGNARRAELQTKAGNYDEYLQSLRMSLELSHFDELGRARIAQLINKSNQFNLTTRRYDEEDVRRLEADPKRPLLAGATDRHVRRTRHDRRRDRAPKAR